MVKEENEIEGNWWLPETPDRRVHGRLSYSGAGAQLDLSGALSERDLGVVGADRLDVVFGTTHEEDEVTVFRALRTRATLLVHSDFARQSFVSSTVLLGAHVPAWSSFQISACEAEFTHLDEWIDLGGFMVEVTDPLSGDVADDFLFRVTYRRIDLPSLHVSPFTVKFRFATSVPLIFSHEISLREATSLLIETSKPLLYEDLARDVIWPLRNLVTLATDGPGVVKRIRVQLAENAKWAEIIEPQRSTVAESKARLHMLFGYSQVRDRLASMFATWFALYGKLAPALNALFSVIYNDVQSTDTKFLTVSQAAEGYHRRSNPLPQADIEAYERSVASIIAGAPEADRVWLGRKLENSYGPTFTDRVEDLFMRLGQEFLKPMFSNRKKVASGAWRIGDWRNKLTHMRIEPAEISANLREIHACTNQLLIALKANLLLDLGFAAADLAKAFQYNQTYQIFSRRDAPF